MTLKQLFPAVDYKGPGGWRVADPESGQPDPIEQPDDTARRASWPTAGKNVVFVTLVDGKPKQHPPQFLSVNAQSPIQRRPEGGWLDVYAYEVVG